MVTFVSATLLVLTLETSTSVTMSAIEVADYNTCNYLGKTWVNNCDKHQNRTYECIQRVIKK